MRLYVVEVEVDDSSEPAGDDDFIRDEITSVLEEIDGVIGITIDLLDD